MSVRHPVIAVTGSSGAGTTSVMRTFDQIFRRESIRAVMARATPSTATTAREMRAAMAEAARAGNPHFSHFGPEANLFEELEALFRVYGETGGGRLRIYLHDDEEAAPHRQAPGTFTPWEDVPAGHRPPLLRGPARRVVTERVDVARHADLLVGVVPDREPRVDPEDQPRPGRARLLHRGGGRHHPAPHAGLRELHLPAVLADAPQLPARPHRRHLEPVRRARHPHADESFVVIRFRDPRGIDFPYLLTMLHDAFMSRANSIVVPGGKMAVAMQLILTPMILQLMDRKRRAA